MKKKDVQPPLAEAMRLGPLRGSDRYPASAAAIVDPRSEVCRVFWKAPENEAATCASISPFFCGTWTSVSWSKEIAQFRSAWTAVAAVVLELAKLREDFWQSRMNILPERTQFLADIFNIISLLDAHTPVHWRIVGQSVQIKANAAAREPAHMPDSGIIMRPSFMASPMQAETKPGMPRCFGYLWGYTMITTATEYLRSLKAAKSAPRYRSNTPSLPANIQDHLGRLLRAEYYERGDKPRFLGDPALPLEFDPYLQRLDQKERELRSSMIGERGRHAVAAALLGIHG